MVRELFTAGLLAITLGFTPIRPGAPFPPLRLEKIWDIDLEEPSGLTALPDGALLSVGDGPRGLVYKIRFEEERPVTEANWLDIRTLKNAPRKDFPPEAPDLESVFPVAGGRIAVGLEHSSEIWEIDLEKKTVTRTWALPPIPEGGPFPECSGPIHNHGLEGAAYDASRKWILAAHERCQPALILFDAREISEGEKPAAPKKPPPPPLKVWARDDLNYALGRKGKDTDVGTFSGITWTGRPGEFLVIDRLWREVILIEISEDLGLKETGRWTYLGIFTETGLHTRFGNVEGIALLPGVLYLVSDPGDGKTAQLARFGWR